MMSALKDFAEAVRAAQAKQPSLGGEVKAMTREAAPCSCSSGTKADGIM